MMTKINENSISKWPATNQKKAKVADLSLITED